MLTWSSLGLGRYCAADAESQAEHCRLRLTPTYRSDNLTDTCISVIYQLWLRGCCPSVCPSRLLMNLVRWLRPGACAHTGAGPLRPLRAGCSTRHITYWQLGEAIASALYYRCTELRGRRHSPLALISTIVIVTRRENYLFLQKST